MKDEFKGISDWMCSRDAWLCTIPVIHLCTHTKHFLNMTFIFVCLFSHFWHSISVIHPQSQHISSLSSQHNTCMSNLCVFNKVFLLRAYDYDMYILYMWLWYWCKLENSFFSYKLTKARKVWSNEGKVSFTPWSLDGCNLLQRWQTPGN